MDNKGLKILLISPIPPPAGGIATWTTQYIEWSKKNNLNLSLINTSLEGTRAKHINSRRKIVDEIKRTAKISLNISKKMKSVKPDIVHLNTPCGFFGIIRDYLSVLMIKKSNAKLVVHYRCNIQDQVKNVIQKKILRKISSLADTNFVLNSQSQLYLEKEFDQKSKLLPNFIDEEFITNEIVVKATPVKTICFIGHIQKTKGFFEIIDVAKKLPKIKFLLAGPIGKKVEDVEVPKNIEFLGVLPKVKIKKIFEQSDVFLFPTYTEGFSNALLEAMASGLPIITTPVGANADMIEKSGGILIPVGQHESIVRAIQKLHDYELRLEMSKWNIQKTKEYYTINKVMNQIVLEYNKLVESEVK